MSLSVYGGLCAINCFLYASEITTVNGYTKKLEGLKPNCKTHFLRVPVFLFVDGLIGYWIHVTIANWQNFKKVPKF